MKMKDNGFMVACLGASLIDIGVFGGLVFPKWSEAGTAKSNISSTTKQISARVADLPGSPDTTTWNDQRNKLKTKYADTAGSLAKKDAALEQWFPGVTKET